MPSQFPGMDPYLEGPAIWPDFHDAFAGEIRNQLNHTLPAPYCARLEIRPEIGIAEISKSYELNVLDETLRHHFIEIRDPAQGHKLITLIEIASPSNKCRGPDREAYERKQREVLESDANLVEIDLLRAGDRLLSSPHLRDLLGKLEPACDYVVLVNRHWRRVTDGTGYQVFPFGLKEMMPCIPVPLRQGEPEVPLDLQYLFNMAYDGGPYERGAVDYARDPDPPLQGDDAAWATEVLRAARSG